MISFKICFINAVQIGQCQVCVSTVTSIQPDTFLELLITEKHFNLYMFFYFASFQLSVQYCLMGTPEITITFYSNTEKPFKVRQKPLRT